MTTTDACRALRHSGVICDRPTVQDTGLCRHHGGLAPKAAERAAERVLAEKRRRRDRDHIRQLADVHRHELDRWFDDHTDTIYARLGLTRQETSR